MKKVSNSCLGAVLLSNLFMICLQKGSIDCISFTKVSLELSSLLLLVVSLLTSALGVLSVFMSILSGDCFSSFNKSCVSHPTSSGNGLDHIYRYGFCSIWVLLVFFREFH